jgi:magnesium transporter
MIVDCAVYDQGKRRDGQLDLSGAVKACRDDGAFVWIGLYEPTAEEFDSVTREFDLHELAVEDAIKAHQRPKLEVYDEMAFLVLKTARYVDHDEVIALGEILVFLGANYIITVRHGSASDLHEVRARVEGDPERLERGPGAVLHAIVDRVVDDYLPAIEGLEEDVEEVEAAVFSPERAAPGTTERIYKLKREVLEFIRATAPLVEPMRRLAEGRHNAVHIDVRPYFRDVNDHLVRVHEQLEGFRDLLTSVLEANLTQVGVRQNEDMRKISAWVAIAAVPTMIAGIYGMNFEHMPELKWTFGYPLVLLVMAVVCGSMFRAFKRAGWL